MRYGPVLLPAALALASVAPFACAGFGATDGGGPEGDAGSLDASEADGGTGDFASSADAGRARTLYVFGGVTIVAETERHVFEAYAASIHDDGSLGSWERYPALDVGRSYMATISSEGGLLVAAGGNGVSFGRDASDNFTFFRDDVATAGGDAPGPWRVSPPLGMGNGRWAAAGTFAAGRAYVSGGTVTGGGATRTVMAAPVTGTPEALQPWQTVGMLPSAITQHGLVALGSRVYVLGGAATTAGSSAVSAGTSVTTIAPDGTLGEWVPAGKLPRPVEGFGVVVDDDDRVFVVGGDDGTESSSAVFIGGTAGAGQELVWQETSSLGRARSHLCVLRANGRLYAIGGAPTGGVSSVVEIGEVSGNSVSWTETTPLPVARSALGCAAR